MGKRGPGATRQRLAREQAATTRTRRLPWKAKGLARAERVIKFLEWLPISGGIRQGKRMKLLPSQREFVNAIFATDRHGRRRVSLAILSEPKGNGKSGLVSGICLAALLGPESVERGHVYSASISRSKASVIFEEMKAIILRVPEFACRVNVTEFPKRMTVLEGDGFDSIYEPLSADAAEAQGLKPILWAYDELGEAPNGKLLSVLMESEGKHNETLGIVLSTQAREDDHPLSKLIDDALARSDDPSIHLQLYAAPDDADPFADETLRACNPAAGHFLDFAALQKARDRARRIPAFESGYRNWRLNQRADSSEEKRIVTIAVWKEGNKPVDRRALRGRRCFGGLDLSGKHDLTAFVLVFPSDDADPFYDIVPTFWTPQGQLEARRPAEQERFRQWIREKHLIATPGNTIRYEFVATEMAKLAVEFDIRAVAFDKYRIDDLKPELDDHGWTAPLEEHQQGFISMFPAIEKFAELALAGRLRHGGHPVLTAAVANAIVVHDPAGNSKIDKDKSNGRGPVRVDGAVALAMALNIATRFVDTPPPPSIDAFLADPVMVI